jgi:hypothetical protein
MADHRPISMRRIAPRHPLDAPRLVQQCLRVILHRSHTITVAEMKGPVPAGEIGEQFKTMVRA